MKEKKILILMMTLILLAKYAVIQSAQAAGAGEIVINEVAWAGSADSANDEWIELFNTTGTAIDLTGWKIVDDQGAQIYQLSGSVAANGYYLIEDSEAAVQPTEADAVINVSLSNSGDSLVLFDATGQMIDAVNSSGGAWFAGNATSRATMERINVLASGDDPANWATSTGAGSTATASGGSLIIGTPRMVNSKTSVPSSGTKVALELSSISPSAGEVLTVTVKASNVKDLFSYGLEIDYDPAVLSYKTASKGAFLDEGGAVGTSFQSGLENGVAGKLLVAEARTQEVKSGVSGSGALFTVQFDVSGYAGLVSNISAGASSFLADTAGDISAGFSGAQFTTASGGIDPVTNAQVVEEAERYSLQINWQAPAGGADKYKIMRKNPHGALVQIGETQNISFVDFDAVTGGGKIIPQLEYCYSVIAVKGSLESAPVEACGQETRGLKGDNNRSDRVDGRDLDNLARHFAQKEADAGFDSLVDTTYDGQVDGSDLIDLGTSFARLYKP